MADVVWGGRRILAKHYRHFLPLFLLFSLLFSFHLFLLPSLFPSLNDQIIKQSHLLPTTLQHYFTNPQSLILQSLQPKPILYSLSLISLFFSFSIIIIYTVYYHRFVRLIKSYLRSFPRLLMTFLSSQLILFSLYIFYALTLSTVFELMGFLGFSSNSFTLVFLVSLPLLLISVVHLKADWVVAYQVVVVERIWGFEALKTSAHLVSKDRDGAIGLVLQYGFMTWWDALGVYLALVAPEGSWGFGIWVSTASALGGLLMCDSAAATTVYYKYCKREAAKGKVKSKREIAQEKVKRKRELAKEKVKRKRELAKEKVKSGGQNT